MKFFNHRNVWGQVLKYNKSYSIFAIGPGHYGYNFQEQFITSLPEEILYKRSFLILKILGGDMKSDIARPLNALLDEVLSKSRCLLCKIITK